MAISINGASYFNLTPTSTDSDAYKMESLKGVINQAKSEQATDDEMMEACKGFEAYFIEYVFKEMKKTVQSSDDEGQYMQYFGDMLTEQYAKDIVDGPGLGIAKMLYESMKRNA